jgi:hypothetical protein
MPLITQAHPQLIRLGYNVVAASEWRWRHRTVELSPATVALRFAPRCFGVRSSFPYITQTAEHHNQYHHGILTLHVSRYSLPASHHHALHHHTARFCTPYQVSGGKAKHRR